MFIGAPTMLGFARAPSVLRIKVTSFLSNCNLYYNYQAFALYLVFLGLSVKSKHLQYHSGLFRLLLICHTFFTFKTEKSKARILTKLKTCCCSLELPVSSPSLKRKHGCLNTFLLHKHNLCHKMFLRILIQ